MMQNNLIYDDFELWKSNRGYKTYGYFWDFLLWPFAPLICLFNGGIGFGKTEDNYLAKIWNEERRNYYSLLKAKRGMYEPDTR
jgi:hypothetical protein